MRDDVLVSTAAVVTTHAKILFGRARGARIGDRGDDHTEIFHGPDADDILKGWIMTAQTDSEPSLRIPQNDPGPKP